MTTPKLRIRRTTKPIITWLGSGITSQSKWKVSNTNEIKLDERYSRQQNAMNEKFNEQLKRKHSNDNNQLEILLPHLQSDMALILVLVQDCSVPLNVASSFSHTMLAPPPNPSGE